MCPRKNYPGYRGDDIRIIKIFLAQIRTYPQGDIKKGIFRIFESIAMSPTFPRKYRLNDNKVVFTFSKTIR